MGHAIHFLDRLHRLAPAHVDFAFHLYRTPLLARTIADRLVPEGEDRVALCLEDGDQGPFIVLARGGRFVTALAKGMSPGERTVVPRARLDEIEAVMEALRGAAARRYAFERFRADRYKRLMYGRSHRLTREEWDELEESQGLFLLDYLMTTVRGRKGVNAHLDAVNARLPRRLGVPKGPLREQLVAWWRRWHTYQHAALLCAQEPTLVDTISEGNAGDVFLAVPSFLLGQRTYGAVLRGLWIAARTGAWILDALLETLRTNDNPVVLHDALLAVTAAASAHLPRRGEVIDLLEDLGRGRFEGRRPDGTADAGCRAMLSQVAQWLLPAIRDPEDARETFAEACRCIYEAVQEPAGGDGPKADDLALEDLAGFVCGFPDTWLHPGWKVGPIVVKAATQVVGGLPARALYPPQALMPLLDGFGDEGQVAAELLTVESSLVPRRPVTRTSRVGRNDPCPCGSGRKYKRCCAA